MKGTCDDLAVFQASGIQYRCHSDFQKKNVSYAYPTFLPCPYYKSKCGGVDPQLSITSDNEKRLEAVGLKQGDVCMWSITYTQVDSNLKVWIEKLVDGEITIVDGLSSHPYNDPTQNMTGFQQLL